jgi:hypothetical protein
MIGHKRPTEVEEPWASWTAASMVEDVAVSACGLEQTSKLAVVTQTTLCRWTQKILNAVKAPFPKCASPSNRHCYIHKTSRRGGSCWAQVDIVIVVGSHQLQQQLPPAQGHKTRYGATWSTAPKNCRQVVRGQAPRGPDRWRLGASLVRQVIRHQGWAPSPCLWTV